MAKARTASKKKKASARKHYSAEFGPAEIDLGGLRARSLRSGSYDFDPRTGKIIGPTSRRELKKLAKTAPSRAKKAELLRKAAQKHARVRAKRGTRWYGSTMHDELAEMEGD